MRLIRKNKKKVKKIKDLSTGTLQKEDRRNKADISITCHTKKKYETRYLVNYALTIVKARI